MNSDGFEFSDSIFYLIFFLFGKLIMVMVRLMSRYIIIPDKKKKE